ncbi:unnamed protein product [Sphagnum troendelagicum]|uniref:Gustatory receptor n=1 Tax=Sphagnum troendelagicum TaxID=128251 RepID=A0ABP0UHC6_9BRYO
MTMPSWVRLLIMAVFLMSTRLAVPTPEPSPSPLCCCCSRSLFTILWGFAFAFGGLTLDAWHTADAHDQRAASFRRKMYYVVFFGPVALFTNLLALFYDLGAHRLLSKSLNNMPANMPGRERELAKKAAKIIANCKVVLGTSEGKLPQTHGTPIPPDITDQEHALVLGSRLPENSYMVQLNYKGKEALLRSGVLPGYKRLQLLQENTSFAMFLNGMQSFGYVLAAVVRVQSGLLVSPIEIIGLTFSILVFIHSVSHFVAAPCHCPLIVYLSPDQEQDEVLQMCDSTKWSQKQFDKVILFDSFLGSSAVGIPLLLLPFTGSVMFYRPGTPPVHCITADASSRELLFIYLGPLLFTFSAFSYLAIYLCTGCLILSQDQRRMIEDTAQRNIIPTEHDISLENNVHDFIEHIRGVDVVRRGIRILIIDRIHSVGTVGGMILALVTTIVYWDAKFAERTTGIVHIWPFIG